MSQQCYYALNYQTQCNKVVGKRKETSTHTDMQQYLLYLSVLSAENAIQERADCLVASCVKGFISWQTIDWFWTNVLVWLHLCLDNICLPASLRVGAVWPSPSSHGGHDQQLLRRVRRAAVAGYRHSVPRLARPPGCGNFASAPAAFLLVVSHLVIFVLASLCLVNL